MNIINAISIQDGGGLSYLYGIYHFLDKKENLIILDNRAKNKLLKFEKAKVIFLKRGLFRNLNILFIRLNIYKNCLFSNNSKNRYKITEFYLNGIPPFFRYKFLNEKIYIFFQNRNVIKKEFNEKYNFHNIKILIYELLHKILIKIFIEKNDKLIVQTNTMKVLVKNIYNENEVILGERIWGRLKSKNLEIIKKALPSPNKKLLKYIQNISTKNLIFFYPAAFYFHKNHQNLIKAYNLFSVDSNKSTKLILTISKNELKSLKIKNANIICIDKISYQDILYIYKFVDYLIFPSLAESYGMPLIEAKINRVKIIASNLDYVKEVCKPFKVFDPLDYYDIYEKLLQI